MSHTATIGNAPAPHGAGIFVAGPQRRHLLGLDGLVRGEIVELLDAAARYRDLLRTPRWVSDELRGLAVCNAFFEDSTRTRFSFELAEQRLGAIHLSFTTAGSSVSKGETLLDTLRVITAMRVDLVVVRHRSAGSAAFLARHLAAGVINGGDGEHEHPTQGLLDLMTLREAWSGRFEGRRIAIVGDVAHSRVARSAIFGLVTLGAEVVLAGPATLLPADVESLGCSVAPTVEDALRGADAVMALRLQRERMESGLLPSLAEYARVWGIHRDRVALLAPGGVVMHPGPMNRGVEIAPDVADGQHSVIFDQVENGVAVRCAVLARCARASSEAS